MLSSLSSEGNSCLEWEDEWDVELPAVDPLAVYKALWQDEAVGRAVLEVVDRGERFRVLSVNDAIAQSALFMTPSLMGRALSEVCPAQYIQTYINGCRCCVQTAQSVSFEIDSSEAVDLPLSVWKIVVMPMQSESGVVSQLLVSATEVTAAKQTEARLKAALEDARTVIDHAEEAIFVYTVDRDIVDVNETVLKMHGISREQALSYSITNEYAVPDSPVHLLPELWGRALSGEQVDIVWPVKRIFDGRRLTVEVTLKKIILSSGAHVLACVRDVSDRQEIREQQNRLLDILEATPDLVGIADAEGNSLYLNPAGQHLLGIYEQDFLVLEALTPDAQITFRETIVPHMLKHGSWRGESMLVSRTGKQFPVSMVMIAHMDNSGALNCMSTIVRDISLEKAAEARMREREQFLSSIYNGTDITIFAWDLFMEDGCKQAKCSGWNPTCEAATGMRAVDVLGNSPVDVFGLEQGQEILNNVWTCAKKQTPICYEEELEIEGKPTWWATKLNPIQDDSGKTYRVVGTTTNVTELKLTAIDLEAYSCLQTEQTHQLSAALSELKQTQTQIVQSEKMASLGQLVAGVAHEINNPVNFIHANLKPACNYATDLLGLIALYQQEYPRPSDALADMLEDMEFEFIQKDFLELLGSMKNGTQRIKEIVLSLRNFSRLDESDLKEVDLNAGIDSTLVILTHKLKANALNKSVEVIKNYQLSELVSCYPSQLNQVVMNILANAVDALDTSAQPQIKITTQADEEYATITIEDNGPGIPAEVQSRIFDPFFTTKAIGKGTGMGLSIGYQIVTEKHKGTLTVASEPGGGTVFTIAIPRSQRKSSMAV
ncbi:MAG: PAS domain S-box protein [Cyanobacteria bacterium J06632_3]